MDRYPFFDRVRDWISDRRVADLLAYYPMAYLLAGGLAITLVVFGPATMLTSRRVIEPTLRGTTMIYRRMGWSGIVWYATLYSVVMQSELSQPNCELGQILGGTFACGLVVLMFVSMLTTANRLEDQFSMYYRRARWTGILAATVFFPWLTFPGILAVRRLEKYRRELDAGSVASLEHSRRDDRGRYGL